MSFPRTSAPGSEAHPPPSAAPPSSSYPCASAASTRALAHVATAAALDHPRRFPRVLNVAASTPPSHTAWREKTSQICCSLCATAPQWSR